jgi:signal transduction histidine kinase/ActR/RegA family two-component response regulator
MPFQRADRALQALVVGFVVLTVAVLSSLWLTQRQQTAFGRVTHTLEVQQRLTTVMSRLQDAETGQRGYLLTHRGEFLAPYDAALAALDGDLAGLEAGISDNPRQQPNMARLRVLAGKRVGVLREGLAAARRGETVDSATLLRGRSLMTEARETIAAMNAEEARLLQQRTASAQVQGMQIIGVLLASAAVTLALGVFVFLDGRRRVEAAVTARDALALSNEQLKAEAANRESAEAQIRQLQKMEAVGQLTGGIAHDFNNMLAIVLGSLDMAKRRLHSNLARAETYIDGAVEAAQRATQLTARLLAFSRQQPLAPLAMDVNKLVGGMSEMLRRTIGEHLRVETVLAGGLWRAYVDPGQLENAILNLCVNSRDAMPDGGRLTIETTNAHLDDAYAAAHAEVRAGQYIMVSVSDTGAGMPAEVAERAFDPFYTTKGVGKGTGLGLSQVHGFVKQSGGHVKIYSETGVGTTVKVYLPRHPGAEQDADAADAAPDEAPRALTDEIVLVVEDEERVRHLSVDALRELGYKVVQACDANQALAVMDLQPRVDLLFTDIVMPDMNGRRLADLAREARPDLKVLYTTGYTRNAIVHNGMLDADVAFLPKPFTLDQLALKVRQVLDGQGANRTG